MPHAAYLAELIRHLELHVSPMVLSLTALDTNWSKRDIVIEVLPFDSVGALEEHLIYHTVDVVVMGICLRSDESGIDAVSRLFPLGTSTQIIYMTRYPQYHTQVYRTVHAGFLLKPINVQDLSAALELAIEHKLCQIDRPICVFSGNAMHLISPADIRYLESSKRILHIHAGEIIDTYATIMRFSCLLPKYFFLCHKSFLVNINYVKCLVNDHLELLEGQMIPVSQRRRAYVRKKLSGYSRGV